jgi:hypothetical protein
MVNDKLFTHENEPRPDIHYLISYVKGLLPPDDTRCMDERIEQDVQLRILVNAIQITLRGERPNDPPIEERLKQSKAACLNRLDEALKTHKPKKKGSNLVKTCMLIGSAIMALTIPDWQKGRTSPSDRPPAVPGTIEKRQFNWPIPDKSRQAEVFQPSGFNYSEMHITSTFSMYSGKKHTSVEQSKTTVEIKSLSHRSDSIKGIAGTLLPAKIDTPQLMKNDFCSEKMTMVTITCGKKRIQVFVNVTTHCRQFQGETADLFNFLRSKLNLEENQGEPSGNILKKNPMSNPHESLVVLSGDAEDNIRTMRTVQILKYLQKRNDVSYAGYVSKCRFDNWLSVSQEQGLAFERPH